MWINNVSLDDPNHGKTMPNVMALLRRMHAMATELKTESKGAFDWGSTQTQLTVYPGKVRIWFVCSGFIWE